MVGPVYLETGGGDKTKSVTSNVGAMHEKVGDFELVLTTAAKVVLIGGPL